jgi:predicted nuclease with TOPRIM domain
MGECLNNKCQRDLEDLRKKVDTFWSDGCELEEQLNESNTENNALKDKIKQLSEQIKINDAYIKRLENENAKLSAPTQNKHDAIATPEHDFENVRRLQTPPNVLISQGKTMKDRNAEANWLEQSSTDELIKWIIRDQNDMRKELETTKEHLENQESLNTQLAQENECLQKKLDTLHDATMTYEAATSDSPPPSVGTGKHQSLMDEAGKLSDSDEGSIIIGEYNPIVAAHPKPIVDIAPSPIKPATHRTGSEEILGIAPKQGTTIK